MTARDLRERMVQPRESNGEVMSVSGPEIGVRGDLPFSSAYDDHELVLTRDIELDRLEEMRDRDGQARALLRVLTLPLRRATVAVTPQPPFGQGGSESENAGEEEAALVETVLTQPYHKGGMKHSLVEVLSHLGLGLAEGYVIFEKVWRLVDGRVLLKKLAPRAAPTCRFVLDERGGLESVHQRVTWQGDSLDVYIPAEKVLVWTCQGEENPWYGKGVMTPAFYHYDKKHKLYYCAHLASQFYAVPGRKGRVPESWTDRQVQQFHSQIANLGMTSAVTLKGMEADVEEFGGTGGMPNYIPMIDHHDGMMAKSILAQFLQLATGTGTGSWALSSDQTDLFMLSLETILDEWADLFNMYLIPQLIDWNFGSGAYPRMSFEPIGDKEKTVLREVFQTVFSGGSGLTEDFMFSLEERVADDLALEVDYEALEEERERRKELQDKADQAAIAEMESRAEMAKNPPEDGVSNGGGPPGAGGGSGKPF